MNAVYFTAKQRRAALLKWLRKTYGTKGMFNSAEAFEAKDIFTLLYAGDGWRKCGSDLRELRKAGEIERVGSQWRLVR